MDGNEAFTNWKASRNNTITSATTGTVYLRDSDTTSVGRIFSSRLSYSKGSMVLHMLRKKLGDDEFFNGMKQYLSDANFAFSYAKTEDFKLKMEASSGVSLTDFFDDWIYNEGYPSYQIEWSLPSSQVIQFKLNQQQSHPSVSFFELPVKVRIHGTGGETQDELLNHTFDGELFDRNVTFNVASVEFDPDADLISKNNNVVLSNRIDRIDLELKLIPNPATTSVRIIKPNDVIITQVSLYNITGQLVSIYENQDDINISHLSSGLHFVKLETGSGTIYKSLLKQ